ncbi:hypothetical protein ACP3V3_02960 [Vibrio sp. PNB22_3_1]
MNDNALLLNATTQIQLTSLKMKSLKELENIKTMTLSSPAFNDLHFIFNKSQDGTPLSSTSAINNDKLNSCRWGIFKGTPFLNVTHPHAMQLCHTISTAFNKVGVSTEIKTLPTKLIANTDKQNLAEFRNLLIFRVKDVLKCKSLKTEDEKLQFLNEIVKKHFENELRQHGTPDNVVKLATQNVHVSCTEKELKYLFSKKNLCWHASGDTASKQRNGKSQAFRHGFRSIKLKLPFQILSRSFYLGHFKNMGFGRAKLS